MLIEELRRLNRVDSFDELAIPDLNSEALDLRVASELFAPYRKFTPQTLKTLRTVTDHQGRQVPTVGGLLLFGTNRFARFPDAWVQAGRFAGIDRSRLIDTAEVRSFLPRAAEDAISFVQKHLLREIAIENVRRKETWSVPPVAIREALINATVPPIMRSAGLPFASPCLTIGLRLRTLACFGWV